MTGPAAPEPAVVDAAENSIAVLPFSDMSAARDHEFFCEGMSEEIINSLGRVPDLRVASYTSSSRFKGKDFDSRSIGRELMVAWLLEGEVAAHRQADDDGPGDAAVGEHRQQPMSRAHCAPLTS